MITDISICFQAKTFPTRSSLWWRRSAGICSTCWLTSTGLTLKRQWLWSCRDTWTHCTHISSSSSGNSTWSTPRRSASWMTCRRCCAPPCRPTHTTTWPRDEDDDELCDASPSVTISHENWSKDGAEGLQFSYQHRLVWMFPTGQNNLSPFSFIQEQFIFYFAFVLSFFLRMRSLRFSFLLGNGVSALLSSVPSN